MFGSLTLSASSEASKASKASSPAVAEDVAKHGEDVIHGESASTEASTKASRVGTVKSELVILLALLWVVKHVVCFSCLFELLLSLFVARVAVWVVFDGYLAIGFLYFVFGGVLVDAQNLIIVSFCHSC